MQRAVVITLILCATPVSFAARLDAGPPGADRPAGWRRAALQTVRVAATDHLISERTELDRYLSAGFNTAVVFDANGYDEAGVAWNLKSEEEVRAETTFARQHDLPVILGLAVEPFVPALYRSKGFALVAPSDANGTLPRQTDTEIRERIALWKRYGDDVIVGVIPWYDDVFWQNVDVSRQRHVRDVIKEVAPDWYVFGMIGEHGAVAGDDEIAQRYDPSAFDHLIVLMYPFSVGIYVIGFPLDNAASSDPDGDIARYVDQYIAVMNERFFTRLQPGQLILLVCQAFHYAGEAEGHIPRPGDVTIMMQDGTARIRRLAGQKRNASVACYWWGEENSNITGLSQRPDWLAAVKDVNDRLEKEIRRRVRYP